MFLHVTSAGYIQKKHAVNVNTYTISKMTFHEMGLSENSVYSPMYQWFIIIFIFPMKW